MICNPSDSDLNQIREIWKLCFGDDDETVDFYFSTCFSNDDCYVYKTDGKVVSALQMIPCDISDGKKTYNSKYMYAVCTHPSYQGKGYMTALIEEACRTEFSKGIKAVICVPATESLFGFYSRFGFVKGVYASSAVINRVDLKSVPTDFSYKKNIGISELNKVRNKILKDRAFVSFPEKYMKLCEGFGFDFVRGENFYAIFVEENSAAEVVDCFWKNENGKREMLSALSFVTKADRFTLEYPGEENLKGLIKFYDDNIKTDKIYLGIIME